jgi:hypothetical protein
MMPKITCWIDYSKAKSEGYASIECTAKFPDLSTEELGFSDSGEYWISNRWADVGKFLTYCMKNPIMIDEEYEE